MSSPVFHFLPFCKISYDQIPVHMKQYWNKNVPAFEKA